MNLRLIIVVCLLLSALSSLSIDKTDAKRTTFQQPPMPMTGLAVPSMASYDRLIPELMKKYQVPGGAVAVVKDGRLVFARGYGFADIEANQLVQPDSLFRIASITKPITAVAVMKLVEEGRVSLDAKVFNLIGIPPLPGATVDKRLADITVRQLLYHAGGWNRSISQDPMGRTRQIAQAANVPPPANTETIIRYMQGQPLQYDPGAEYQYSNFGYAVLGRVIEKVTGQSYESYVKTQILRPAGVNCMRIGHTLLAERAEREVRYYDYPNAALAPSVFATGPQSVPSPYGGFYLEAMDSHGGWLASPVDLLRFVTAVDGRNTRPDILLPTTINQMVARPAPPLWAGSNSFYAMGWSVRPIGNEADWWHGGSLAGTDSFMLKTYNGYAWAAVFNMNPAEATFGNELGSVLYQAFGEVTQWPTHNLFGQFGGCVAPRSLASVSAASYAGDASLAPASVAAAFGTELSASINVATAVPLPTALGGTNVLVKDSAGIERAAPLFFVAPQQINYQIPPSTAIGSATVTVVNQDIPVARGNVSIANVAPGLFAANANGQGIPAGVVLRLKANGDQNVEPIMRYDTTQNRFVAIPIDFGEPTDRLFLIIFGTGFRGRSTQAAVIVTMAGLSAEVFYAGAQGELVGLDQLNLELPRALSGRGNVTIVLTVDGKAANPMMITIG